MKIDRQPTNLEQALTSDAAKPSASRGAVWRWIYNSVSTLVVLACTLYLGLNLVSLYRGESLPPKSSISDMVGHWPQLESCSLNFGNSTLSLERAEISGPAEIATRFMIQACESILESETSSLHPATDKERQLLDSIASIEPIKEKVGQWAIYQVNRSNGLSQVVGVSIGKDPVELKSVEMPSQSRVTTWSLAFSMDQNRWRVFTVKNGRKGPGAFDDSSLIPVGAKRTITFSDPRGYQLTGFRGGEIDDCKRHFDQWAEKYDLISSEPWHERQGNWMVNYSGTDASNIRGIQVHLCVNHNETGGLISLAPARP
ncbi:MAG: hypothetical protein AAF939_22110 [Planctomycetota bacterium]